MEYSLNGAGVEEGRGRLWMACGGALCLRRCPLCDRGLVVAAGREWGGTTARHSPITYNIDCHPVRLSISG